MKHNISKCVEGARSQLFQVQYPTGEVAHYLWGFSGEYDVTARLTEASYARVLEFLAEGQGDELYGIEGVMASELPDPSDERYVPMGEPVSICLCFMDRDSDDAAWFFDIARAGEEAQPIFADDVHAAVA
ncbi:MAG: hypothetical protein R3F49_15495 [Planctomycetota bacterium]